MDLHRFDADPDPTLHFDADPDPYPNQTLHILRKIIIFLKLSAVPSLLFYLLVSVIVVNILDSTVILKFSEKSIVELYIWLKFGFGSAGPGCGSGKIMPIRPDQNSFEKTAWN